MTTWVFGYGSLVWRMDLPYVERRAAWTSGYARRFFQLSPDHRGTPEAPGRVVTVVAEAGARLVGAAYAIHDQHLSLVLEALDHRERAGYERTVVVVETDYGAVPAMMYVGRDTNPSFSPATDEEVAAVVAAARGPSGDNLEYVERLAEALANLDARDAHVDRIVHLARAMRSRGMPSASVRPEP